MKPLPLWNSASGWGVTDNTQVVIWVTIGHRRGEGAGCFGLGLPEQQVGGRRWAEGSGAGGRLAWRKNCKYPEARAPGAWRVRTGTPGNKEGAWKDRGKNWRFDSRCSWMSVNAPSPFSWPHQRHWIESTPSSSSSLDLGQQGLLIALRAHWLLLHSRLG